MISPHQVFWEAIYDDGSVLSEAAGGRYRDIDRSKLSAFRLVALSLGELITIPVDYEHPGHALFYRRRTIIRIGEGRKVFFLFGFIPMGPVFAFDPSREEYWASRYPEDYRSVGIGQIDPMEHEGERFTVALQR